MTVVFARPTIEVEVRDTAKDRHLTRAFRILNPEFAALDHEETFIPVLEVSTYHDKEGKRFITSINRVRKSPMWTRLIMDIAGRDTSCPVRQYTGTPVARYSAKALQDKHDDTLAQIDAMDPETFQDLLEWASTARM